MKKIVLTAAAVIAYSLTWAQYNTTWYVNPSPVTSAIANTSAAGYIGIGTRSTNGTANTPSPTFNLHLHGTSDYTIAVIQPFPQPPLMQNVGKTTRIGLTNTTTGMTETDGAVIRMSDNNLLIENREAGDFQLAAGANSFILSGTNNRTWMNSNLGAGTEFAKFNVSGISDNCLYLNAPTGKYGLSVRSGNLTDNAIQIMGTDGAAARFSVKSNGSVAINSTLLATATTPVISINNGTTPTFTVLKSGEVQYFLNSTTTTDKALTISNTTQKLLQLTNDGLLRTRGVKVDAVGWSDYVFEKEYKLRSLNEVEEYIDANGHLPEVPSTAEVNEKGVDVAEMNATLLKKIEELTLYVIDQNKQLEELKSEMKELKADK